MVKRFTYAQPSNATTRSKKDVTLPGGGCTTVERIQVRPATAAKRELIWSANDVSFGDTINDTSDILTKASRLF